MFKVEGRIVRELVMAIDSKNMKWLKNEFKREKDEMLTGPQFIKSIGQVSDHERRAKRAEERIDELVYNVLDERSESDTREERERHTLVASLLGSSVNALTPLTRPPTPTAADQSRKLDGRR